jgi:putative tryptophan/tyrosine transport system substrate-binding protein
MPPSPVATPLAAFPGEGTLRPGLARSPSMESLRRPKRPPGAGRSGASLPSRCRVPAEGSAMITPGQGRIERRLAAILAAGIARREFMAVLGGAAIVWPLAARAQKSGPVRRVGVLMADAEGDPEGQSSAAALRHGLEELGWVDGRNLRLDYRWAAGDVGRVRAFAKELVELQPDAIIGRSTPAIAALLRETRSLPIVFTTISDPIGSGFVSSLAHPGGNITGFTNFESSIGGKWLGLLKEIAPGIVRTAMMFNPEAAPYAQYYVGPFERAARLFAVEPISAPVHDDVDIEREIAALARKPDGGLIVLPDAFTTSLHRRQIIERAARHHLPAIYPYRFIAADDGRVFEPSRDRRAQRGAQHPGAARDGLRPE